MGSLQSWRKAYGAIKDSTTVSLAKMNSEYKDVDVAIVKATNHVECPPKERHIRKIFASASASAIRPRADAAYCIHALARRLHKTHSWTVALKTLIVIHRILREGDPIFREELLNFSYRGQILQISNFKDDSSPLAWDYSAWIRSYALFLEERLECFRILKYDIEAECLVKPSQGTAKGHNRTRDLGCEDLLEQLPALQQLLFRLIGCQPEGAAFSNLLIQYALALVLKESFKIYCAINDGVINLVDLFFEMSKHHANKALDIYKRAGQQAEDLSEFYKFCKSLELARIFQFPILGQPPATFLATMEEYIKEAPSIRSLSNKKLEYKEANLLTYGQEETPPESLQPTVNPEENPTVEETQEPPRPISEPEIASQPPPITGDLVCLDDINPAVAELEESNALALAIVQPGHHPKPLLGSGFLDCGSSGWELALVTAPSSNDDHVAGSKMAGGFDKLLLDSLYEDANARIQHNAGGYGGGLAPNPFEAQDPFFMSNGISPPPNVQMAIMAQQQQYLQMQQQQQQHNMMSTPYTHQPQYYHPSVGMGSANPFHDPFVAVSHNIPPQGNPYLI